MAIWKTIFKRRSQPSDTGGKLDLNLDGLPQLMVDAQDVLHSISTVFPFVLFTDKIIIRRNHIDVVRGVFFGSGGSQRMQYSDIREVAIAHNPFFATIEFTLIGPPFIFTKVKFLPKGETFRAKRIILGLVECDRKKIDLSKYGTQELIAYLEEIGKTRE